MMWQLLRSGVFDGRFPGYNPRAPELPADMTP